MRKPIAYIKNEEISFMLGVKQAGATSWKTNLGLVPQEGDVPLYEGKEWVALTDEEIEALGDKFRWHQVFEFARAIEAKLKEKNR